LEPIAIGIQTNREYLATRQMAFLTRLKGYRTRHAIRFISAGLARFHIR